MRNRWYAPRLGQFISHDPLGTYDSSNMYAFVGFDPINFWDPWGLTASGFARDYFAGDPYNFGRRSPEELREGGEKFKLGLLKAAANSYVSTAKMGACMTGALLSVPVCGALELTGHGVFVNEIPYNDDWEQTGGNFGNVVLGAGSVVSGGLGAGTGLLNLAKGGSTAKKAFDRVRVLLTRGGEIGKNVASRIKNTVARRGKAVPQTRRPPFESTDPLVADLANEIESLRPGYVVDVNVEKKVNGSRVTDYDIELQDVIIQVRDSPKSKNAVRQVRVSEKYSGKRAVYYNPSLRNRAKYQLTEKDGIEAYTSKGELFKALGLQ